MVAADDPRYRPGKTPTRDQVVDQFLLAIMAQESGGQNVLTRLRGSASGFWQIIDSTWARFGGFARAMDAPFQVQLAKARAMAGEYYDRYGGDVRLMSAAWYGGTGTADKLKSGRLSWDYVPGRSSGNTVTLGHYANRTVQTIGGIPAGSTVTPEAGRSIATGGLSVGAGAGVDWTALKALTDAGLSQDQIKALAAAVDAGKLGGANPNVAAPSTININFGPGLSAGGGVTQGLTVSPPALDPSASPAEVEAYFRKYYGAFAWMLSDPELAAVLRRAAVDGLDAMGIQAALQQTRWWGTHSAAMRNWEALANTDKFEAERQLQQKALSVKLAARRLGVDMDEARSRDLAWTALRLGWNDQELQAALVNEVKYSPHLGGDAGATIDQVKAKAHAYMVPIADDTAFGLMKKMASGELSEDGLNHYFLDLAKGRFPQLTQYLDAGITPEQFFEPYRQLTAQVLELNPQQINLLDDPRFSSMVETVGSDGKRRPMTLSEAGRYLRGLPDYRNTDQANSQAAELVRSIGQLFGRAL